MRLITRSAAGLALSLLTCAPVLAQQLALQLTQYATGLSQPVDLAHAPTDNRLYAVEKAGRIRIVEPGGTVVAQPMLDISALVLSSGGEQGLLGLAFHPNYATNGYLYVNYTQKPNGATRVSRFTRLTANSVDPASEVILLTVPQPFSNHNGGCLKFGPDGYLYISLGDGGSGGDPGNRAQNTNELLGKMLRIDVDGSTGGLPYGIPASNPFATQAGARGEIWGWGLRNVWRFSFDRATGDAWLADVGQGQWEEVDVVPATMSNNQRNFGWRCYEGNHPYNAAGCGPMADYLPPIFEYSHAVGQSITGGFVYRGTQSPALRGRYVCCDYVSGKFWTISPDTATPGAFVSMLDPALVRNDIVTFGEDSTAELYCASLQGGAIYRLSATGPVLPNGLSTAASAAPLHLLPNPATRECRVTVPVGTTQVEIVSAVTGQVLRTENVTTTTELTLNLRGLAPGLYAVRSRGARPGVARLVVQ